MDATTYAGLWQFEELFVANNAAYVRESRVHIDAPLTPDLLADAYINRYAVSGYTARLKDGVMVTRLGAIDFDKASPEQINDVQNTLFKMNIPHLTAETARGCHIWIHVLQGEVPAAHVRQALTHCIRLTSPDILPLCEVFPKDSTAQWGAGALRLPLMVHPKTHLRYPCYAMDGARITKIADLVAAMPYTEYASIKSLADSEPIDYPRDLGVYRRKVDHGDVGSAVQLLAEMGVQATPGHSCRCPFHEDRKASLSVALDDERVWCKSPECDAYNGGRGVGTLALRKMVQR